MNTPMPHGASATARWLHRILMLSALAAWLTAVMGPAPGGDGWKLHRLFGAAVAAMTVWGWCEALHNGRVPRWPASWRRGVMALRGLFGGQGTAADQREAVQQALIVPCLLLAAIVTVTGLPGVVTLDRLFQPAAWVLWSRRLHGLAADALVSVWAVELAAQASVAIGRLGRGRAATPVGPAVALSLSGRVEKTNHS